MLKRAIVYPARGEGAGKRLLIGGGLVSALLWIVLVGFVLQFYVYVSVSYVAGRSVERAAD